MSVKELTDNALLQKTTSLRAKEKALSYYLLLYYGEVDSRKLYRDMGYSCFYLYLTEGLGYSDGAASRRVKASRVLRKHPELYEELKSERLSFMALVELSKVLTEENKEELVRKCVGKPKKEVFRVVEELTAPGVKVRRKESVRLVKPKASPKSESPLFSQKSTATSTVDNGTSNQS